MSARIGVLWVFFGRKSGDLSRKFTDCGEKSQKVRKQRRLQGFLLEFSGFEGFSRLGFCRMSRINQALVDIGYQIENLKNDLIQTKEQYDSIEEQAQDAKLRSIVSEIPQQAEYAHEMEVAKQRLSKVIDQINREIQDLRNKQDELLEKLFEETNYE